MLAYIIRAFAQLYFFLCVTAIHTPWKRASVSSTAYMCISQSPTERCLPAADPSVLVACLLQVKERKCAYPNQCEDNVVTNASSIMSCKGEPVTTAGPKTFGLAPIQFGEIGFADFLFSVTDQRYVFRNNELRETGGYIDSLTQSIKIILCFFSPQYGVTTVMTVEGDLSGVTSADVAVKVQHYSILEGDRLVTFIVILAFVIVFVLIMLADVCRTLFIIVHKFRTERKIPTLSTIALLIIDLLSICTSMATVAMRVPSKVESAGNVDRILGNLAGIPWASSDYTVKYKKETFFENVIEMIRLMNQDEAIDSFLNFTLLLLLIRVIQCTSIHPRLALLTGTVSKAADDFMHTALLIILIMGCFAGIGTWRFGGYRPEFATWEVTMQTQFMWMIGAVGENWADNTDLQAFTVLFLMVMFLLVLNFVLAIIVEAYMGVRKANEECVIEMDFFSDIITTGYAYVLGTIHNWPSNRLLGLYLQGINAKFHVTFWDLHRSGLFPTQKSMETFINFYGIFEFCGPIQFNSFGKVDTSEQAEDREWMTKILVSMLDKRPVKLKDMPKVEGAKSKKKRASGVFKDGNELFKPVPFTGGANGPKEDFLRVPSGSVRQASTIVTIRQDESL